ncbi:MAG: hypothetical protein LBH81_02960 [Rickettsiales bacterium]|nr:hypothetical protein [Rickettsiales bacterium]
MSNRTLKQQERRNKRMQEPGHKKHENKYSGEKQEKGKNGLIIMKCNGAGSAVSVNRALGLCSDASDELVAKRLEEKLAATGSARLQPSDRISYIMELERAKQRIKDAQLYRGRGW